MLSSLSSWRSKLSDNSRRVFLRFDKPPSLAMRRVNLHIIGKGPPVARPRPFWFLVGSNPWKNIQAFLDCVFSALWSTLSLWHANYFNIVLVAPELSRRPLWRSGTHYRPSVEGDILYCWDSPLHGHLRYEAHHSRRWAIVRPSHLGLRSSKT